MFTQNLEEILEIREGEPIKAQVIAPKSERIMWYRNGERVKV